MKKQEKLAKIQLIEIKIQETYTQLNSWTQDLKNYTDTLADLTQQLSQIKNSLNINQK